MEIVVFRIRFSIPVCVAGMIDKADNKIRATLRSERSVTGPAGRPTIRKETLATKGFEWSGGLDRMRSGIDDETGERTNLS